MPDTSTVISAEIIDKLCHKKIFFAHQSVGYNIVEGIGEVAATCPETSLNLRETREPADFDQSIFAHTRVGNNTDAIGKINDFTGLITDKIGSVLDIAFLKLCYVDVTAASDIQAVFDAYRSAVVKIVAIHPDLTVVHWTVPLTVSRITWKTKVKKILGKRLWECEDNIKRFRFNELIRDHYAESQPVFDLARIESGIIEDQQTSFHLSGVKVETLYPGYTNDGGHLNAIGRKVVAEQLLLFLSAL
jgi:hypothetical protein